MLKCFTLNGKNALTILIKYPYILTSALAIVSATVKAHKPTVTELPFLVLFLFLFFSVGCLCSAVSHLCFTDSTVCASRRSWTR